MDERERIKAVARELLPSFDGKRRTGSVVAVSGIIAAVLIVGMLAREVNIGNRTTIVQGSQASVGTEEKTAQECRIKGNIGAGGLRLYYLPEHPRYSQVKIDTEEGEMWFCNDYQAIKAGWDMAPLPAASKANP